MQNGDEELVAYDNIQFWLTVSGDEIRSELEPYFETYRERFLEVIDKVASNNSKTSTADESQELFRKAASYQSLDALTEISTTDYSLLAAYGLVIFDRLNSQWDSLSKADLFAMHEQLFDCYVLSAKMLGRQEDARSRALKGHAKRLQAKEFVVGDWERFRRDYAFNKSAFARDYVKRVSNEFHVKVTEKQLREVWLLDALPETKSHDSREPL